MALDGGGRRTWHLLTGEYPPQPGGVGDYSRLVAQGLAQAGDKVHVWTSADSRPIPDDNGVVVHRLPDCFGPRGLRELSAGLRNGATHSQVLVQYVPHMYGYRAMNVAFAAWLRLRAPRYWIMFHEVTFAFDRRQKWTRNILASVQHTMAALAAGGAERIFVSVPRWADLLQARCLVRRPVQWLPVPSNVPTAVDTNAVLKVREELLATATGHLLGHFGTFQQQIADFLMKVIPQLLHIDENRRLVLIGRGAESFKRSLVDGTIDLRDRIIARDDLPGRDVAEHLAACDVLVQPYADGVSSRRGSAMAGLALGRPMVTTEAEATEPLWHSEGLVEAVAPSDVAGFIERVESLLSSAEERVRLGNRARLGYEANFSCQKTIAMLRAL